MGSVIDYAKCPQCGGVVCDDYYYKTGEKYYHCMRCGRWGSVKLPRTDKEKAQLLDGSKYLVSHGDGYGRGYIAAKNGASMSFSLKEPYSEEIEKQFLEAMKDKKVDVESSYLTSWDTETQQLIVVHGRDPGLYEDVMKDGDIEQEQEKTQVVV